MRDPVAEWSAAPGRAPGVVLTVEHAGEALPEGVSWPEADLRLVGTHWFADLGIVPFTRALAGLTGAPAVLSRFSRLWVDPNRPLDAPTLFRAEAEGLPVLLNQQLDAAQRAERIERCWRPYHAAVDALVARHPGADVLGLHSFTPTYEGRPRSVEIGVLFDEDDELGAAWMEALTGKGFDVQANEPWSGKQGLMFSPQRHATHHGRQAIELEVRQDLLLDPARCAEVARLVAQVIAELHPPRG